MEPNKKPKYLMILGENIRKARREKHWSLEKLAALSNHEKANLSRLENGRSNPSIITLMSICEALEIDINDFFKGLKC